MRLSTRLTTAMLVHAFIIVVMLAALNYRVFEAAGMPGGADRFRQLGRDVAEDLDAATAGVRTGLLELRAAPGTRGIVRASLAGSTEGDRRTLDQHRAELAARCTTALATAPAWRRCSLIGVTGGGREIVGVERTAVGDTVRAVGNAGPAPGSDAAEQELIRRTSGLPDGEIYVSAVETDGGRSAGAATGRISVATPVMTDDGRPFAIVVITIDLGPVFAKIRAAQMPRRPALLVQLPRRSMSLIDEQGTYLLHPDPAGEFGLGQGAPPSLQNDFPSLTEAAWRLNEFGPAVLIGPAGERYIVGLTNVRLAGGRTATVVQTIPFSTAYSTGRIVLASTLIGALLAVLAAIAIAVLLGRTMSRPIVQMTDAVAAFGRGAPMALPKGASGEIGVLAEAFGRMADEVTEKTSAMRQTAEILDLIMERMADAVLLVDANAGILFANAAAKELLGDRTTLGWNAWEATYEAFHDDGTTPFPFAEWPLVRALRGESVDSIAMVLRRRGDERTINLTISGRPIESAGGAANSAVLVLRDVTALRETERLLRDSQKMDAIGQLTGGVAHDFNNILTVITGTIDILIAGVADRPVLANIGRMIDEAATRGADLTRQLLAFARKQPLRPRVTDINTLVVETAKLLRPTLGQQIEIESMLEDDAWPVMVDRTQLSTALLNLALNARDAMPNGGKLTLETANVILDEAYVQANPEVKPGPYVMMAVSDTGVGIPATLHHKVFEPFFTTKGVGKGTGLGLSMVYGFVKQSGGHIKIYSEEGSGTAIKLYLPRSDEHASAHDTAPAPAPQGGHETILVVEDDPLVRNFVISQLESLGYTPVAAANATEALALVERGQAFDLLFTDIVMPGGLNGRELAREIARQRPGIRVLYTSGYTENAITHHGRLDPDVALLTKPYRKVDLAQMIRKALDPTPDR
jgi:signal transduction histidine kinase/HAMP domain-containing protein